MAWRLTGQLIETCSCNMLCPCWFTVQELMIMDQGWCASAIAFRTRDGNSDGIARAGARSSSLSTSLGRPCSMATPPPASTSTTVNADQRRELEAICSGQRRPDGGHRHSSRSGCRPGARRSTSQTRATSSPSGSATRAGWESRRLQDPQGQGFTLRGGGFVTGLGMEEVDLSPSRSLVDRRILLRQFETKSGARGEFTWSA